jgi:outer membrane protein
MPVCQAMLTLFASTTYASSNYMDSYFEIDEENSARSGLETFSASEGFKDVAVGAAMQYNLTDTWGILGVVRYAYLLGDAADSPVVDDEGDSSQVIAGLAVNYRW